MTYHGKPLPENIRRCLPVEQRTDNSTRTISDIDERNRVKSEKELQRQILQFLNYKDIAVCCSSFGRRTTIKSGWPDISFAYNGIPYAWEVKVGTNKQTDEQARLQTKMEANGWRYSVIRSMADVVAALSGEVKP